MVGPMKQLGVVVFAVVLGACSKQAPKPMDPNQDPAARAAIEKLDGFRAQACACEDKACADRVTEDFAALGEKHKNTKATEAQIREAGKIAEEYGKCMMAAMGATP